MALDQFALLELLEALKAADVSDRIREATQTIYQALIDAELTAVMGAAPFERTDMRLAHRNGARLRTLSSTPGDLELRIKDMTPIQSRPDEATSRLVLGHWEGDLVVGSHGRSHVGTLVERRSRYLLLLHLPEGAGTDSVIAALTAAINQLPPVLRRSINLGPGPSR